MISIVISNFSNFKFTRNLIESINENTEFSQVSEIIVIDNGDNFENVETKSRLIVHKNEKNIGHGPSMEKGIELCKSEYALILDCDTFIYKKGLVELMLKPLVEDKTIVASGVLTHITPGGIDVVDGIPYLHPYCLMISKDGFMSQEKTLFKKEMSRFINHGAPCKEFFKKRPKISPIQYNDNKKNYCSPVNEYVYHIGRSSRGFDKIRAINSIKKWNSGINVDENKIRYWLEKI